MPDEFLIGLEQLAMPKAGSRFGVAYFLTIVMSPSQQIIHLGGL
jgi:hypothetical protein